MCLDQVTRTSSLPAKVAVIYRTGPFTEPIDPGDGQTPGPGAQGTGEPPGDP